MMPILEVISVGSGMTLQDSGRSGWRRFGVAPGGAMDQHGMVQANRLLGNLQHAPVLELMRQGAQLKVLADTWLALSGGGFCAELPAWSARFFEAGSVLHFSELSEGLWAYLAVPGGFVAPKYFESVSVDTRSGIGSGLKQGERLYAKGPIIAGQYPRVRQRQVHPDLQKVYPDEQQIRLLPGPQYDSFAADSRRLLVEGLWQVSPRSDRTGYRLDGGVLEPAPSIHSEPVISGSIQVTTDGLAIVTMRYGPTVGGYPKIAVIREADLDQFAQCGPGTRIKFIWEHY